MKKDQVNSVISRQQLEMELKRIEKRQCRSNILKSTVLWLLVVGIVSAALSVIRFPVLRVKNDKERGTTVLTMRTQQFQQGDWVVCSRGDDVIIGQIVATAGDRIDYDEQGFVLVNGNERFKANNLDDLRSVSDDFVLLKDQTGEAVSCVCSEEIIGKVILKIGPFGIGG